MSNRALLVAYDTNRDRFDSLYERNKFFRGLFGYRQTVTENGKTYRYEKEGLLSTIPTIKVEDSVIILQDDDAETLMEYLDDWAPQVEYRTFTVVLGDEDWDELRSQDSR